jgi:hypothetical protein
VAGFLSLGRLLVAQPGLYEALDSSGIPTREAKRRGAGGLPGLADSGWSNRLGCYAGFHLLLAVNPVGVITGWGFGSASTKAQPLAATVFALRRPPPARPGEGGSACPGALRGRQGLRRTGQSASGVEKLRSPGPVSAQAY